MALGRAAVITAANTVRILEDFSEANTFAVFCWVISDFVTPDGHLFPSADARTDYWA